jgi:transcriptional regulator with PAS, ATPase and Fis domain
MSADYKELMQKYEAASKELKVKFGHEIIGNSSSVKSTISLMAKVAQTDDTSVLITGESGTGKELVARGIHQMSSRKNNYFCDVNCSAIPESLFESEFFGHVKGAFTGALGNKPGWFEFADKGTLFLDEIGDMPMHQQIIILRVLEQKRIRKVGSNKEVNVDVRIIAATNQDLKKLVEEKKFRLDLYHRLNTFTIHLAPLRDRKEDIELLFDYFVKELSQKMRKHISGWEEKVILNLINYSYPGNIRELRNMIEKALIISDTAKLKLRDFSMADAVNNKPDQRKYNLQLLEKNTITEALRVTRFKREAAKLLNITPQSLERRIEKLGIDENNL